MFKRIVYLSLSILWLTLTFYKPMGILDNLGSLLSYNAGFFNLNSIDQAGQKFNFDAPKKYKLDIHIDELGIPHIYGKDESSVAFGLGYMHARDRYFQMEMMTRKVQGKLAEMVGVKGVESDRFWIPLDFENKAKDLLEKLKKIQPDVYQDMMAYGEGINFYLSKENPKHRAPEYLLMGNNAREWKSHYTLFLSSYMSYMLSYNEDHLKWQQVMNQMPADLVESLYDHKSDSTLSIIDDHTFKVNSFPAGKTTKIDLSMHKTGTVTSLEKVLGSNNWALEASKSASGNAILCNDTHLDLVLPSPWYEAHLSCPTFNTYGLTLPCGPYVVSGHNDQIAWGMTNAYWDENEQYLLKIHPKDTNQYWFEGAWEKMSTKQFNLQIKGYGNSVYKQQYTKLGAVTRIDKKAFVKRWYPSEEGNQSFVSFKRLAKASNWDEFLRAMQNYSYPPQNFAYADVNGNAGMLCAGKLPLRQQGYMGGIQEGTHVYPTQFVAFENLPQSYNPKRGFVSSANNYSAQSNYYINFSFSEIFRIKRINEVLKSKEKLNVKDMEKLQGDNTDVSSRDLAKLILKYDDGSTAFKNFRPLLKWDGEIKSEINEPIIAAYLNYFILNKFDSLLVEQYKVEMRPRTSKTYSFLLNHANFNFKGKKQSSKKLIIEACQRASKQLKLDFGSDLSKIKTGPSRTFIINHLLSLPGWGADVPNAGGNMNTPNVHKGIHGASMRTVIEMDPKGIKSKMILTGGQSGRVNSKNYRDQLIDWRDLTYHEVQLCKKPQDLKGIKTVMKFN